MEFYRIPVDAGDASGLLRRRWREKNGQGNDDGMQERM